MPDHVKQIVLNLLKDYDRHIKNAVELKGKKQKKEVKEADEINLLIKNLVLEYNK